MPYNIEDYISTKERYNLELKTDLYVKLLNNSYYEIQTNKIFQD